MSIIFLLFSLGKGLLAKGTAEHLTGSVASEHVGGE